MAISLIAEFSTVPLPTQIDGFFILPKDVPLGVEEGEYDPWLVVLSFVIGTFASYVALDIASKLTTGNDKSQRVKMFCGALTMGVGIWSMHFIGMLAYRMRMVMTYNPWLTALSMLVAVLFAGAAFFVVRGKKLSNKTILYASPLMGLAVCGMHYIGKFAMRMDAKLLYRPDLFLLSFVIAATASAVALKLMFHARGSRYSLPFNISAALFMGIAVCGMHYTGMAASVLLPYADCRYATDQDFSGLATAVTLITFLVIFVAILVKQLDDALAEAQRHAEQLVQAQKMEAVGQLTGGIAHDFNNMLGIIMGNLEMLSYLPGLPPRAEMFIKTGMSGAKKASELTHRLLAFSRKQVLQPVPSDLRMLIPSALTLAQRAVAPAVTIRSVIPAHLPIVEIDPVHFEGSLLNLILNARDAMPGGGDIVIEAQAAYFGKKQPRGLSLPPGEYVAVSVKDTGKGMSEEVLARAIDPFFTTKEVGKGSGMGLSMVSGFAQQSGGNIAIDSKPGHGTTVTIYIPASAKPAELAVKPRARINAAEGRERVVVVDDEKDLLFFIQSALEDMGYQVRSAENADAALELLKEGEADLLITDILMPGMNGYDLARQAHGRHPAMKVLFISGYTQKESLPDFLPENSSSFLAKPFTVPDLAQAVSDLLRS